MSAFVATGAAQATPHHTLPNNGFFDAIATAHFVAQTRTDQTIPIERISNALQISIIRTNRELADWQAVAIENGTQTLANYPSIDYGDYTEHQILYRNAVYHWAKSLLVENYRDFDTTQSGHERADQMASRVEDHRRLYKEAIRDFLGEPHCTVELI